MNQLLFAIMAVFLSSCASMEEYDFTHLNAGTEGYELPIVPIKKELSESDLVGTYRFGDGFWNWEIHLEEDKTFGHVWISNSFVEDKEGMIGLELGVDVAGQWSLDGDVVILSYERTERYSLVLVGNQLSLVEPILRYDFNRVYVKTSSPLSLRNEKKPNQADHTTPASAPR